MSLLVFAAATGQVYGFGGEGRGKGVLKSSSSSSSSTMYAEDGFPKGQQQQQHI
jgi:hypothetical protein